MGSARTCNNNNVPDECDIADGTSEDLNGNGVPDECDMAGDLDGDGDVDIDDFAIFAGCMAGPDVIEAPAACDPVDFVYADFDNDEDVDLADFSLLQMVFGNP